MLKDNLKYEDAVKKIEGIIYSLHDKNTSLEESIKLYEQGSELIKFCENTLEQAKIKIEYALPEKGRNTNE